MGAKYTDQENNVDEIDELKKQNKAAQGNGNVAHGEEEEKVVEGVPFNYAYP